MDKLFSLFNQRFRPVTTRLTKMIMLINSEQKEQPKNEEIEAEKVELEKRVLPALNSLLNRKQFFCGDEITCFDIQIYCEVSTVLALVEDITIDSDLFPELHQWI